MVPFGLPGHVAWRPLLRLLDRRLRRHSPINVRFQRTVQLDTGPSGWKVAQVRVLLGRLSPLLPEAAYCDVEIGVPEMTHLGVVTDSFAQIEAAEAADVAARRILSRRLPTAILCREFRRELQLLLAASIPGVRVTGFITPGAEYRTFP